MRYFVSLGSNIEPRRNFPLMLRALLQIASTVHISRVVQTAPVGMHGAPFLNAVAALSVDLEPEELKAFFNTAEAILGRDRGDPSSKIRSRTADLDILFTLDPMVVGVPVALLPPEPYIRPMLLELLEAFGVSAEAELLDLPPGVRLSLDGHSFGEAPRTFALVGGHFVATELGLAPVFHV